MPGKSCGLNGSAQLARSLLAGVQNLRFFGGVDLDASRSCPVLIARSRRGRFSSASIVAASGSCFRSCRAAKWLAADRGRMMGLPEVIPPLRLARHLTAVVRSGPEVCLGDRRLLCRLATALNASASEEEDLKHRWISQEVSSP